MIKNGSKSDENDWKSDEKVKKDIQITDFAIKKGRKSQKKNSSAQILPGKRGQKVISETDRGSKFALPLKKAKKVNNIGQKWPKKWTKLGKNGQKSDLDLKMVQKVFIPKTRPKKWKIFFTYFTFKSGLY